MLGAATMFPDEGEIIFYPDTRFIVTMRVVTPAAAYTDAQYLIHLVEVRGRRFHGHWIPWSPRNASLPTGIPMAMESGVPRGARPGCALLSVPVSKSCTAVSRDRSGGVKVGDAGLTDCSNLHLSRR